jgi:ribose/xylose/arabinose/galactoside ABC-type transport system permease subunit
MFKVHTQKFVLLGIIVLICVIAGIINPNFFAVRNFLAILQQIAVLGIIAMVMLILMISGDLDLSLGALIGLCGVILCKFAMAGFPIYPGVAIIILIAVFCGFLNGLIVTKSKSEPLIITLGMSFFYNGLALVISDGGFLSLKGNLAWLGSGKILWIPVSVVVLAVLMILTHFMLKYTKFGRTLHIIGANRELAYLSGIAVDRNKILN